MEKAIQREREWEKDNERERDRERERKQKETTGKAGEDIKQTLSMFIKQC